MDICDSQPIFGENTFSLNYRKLNTREFFTSLEESVDIEDLLGNILEGDD